MTTTVIDDFALLVPTKPGWAEQAYASFDAVLIDHAHCEKKAAASSMSFIAGNPDKDILVKRCAKLAQEELKHFQQVHRILLKRGVSLTPDKGDRYVKVLSKHVRPGGKRLTDRLVLSAIIEARSHERLSLLAGVIEDPELQRFYERLAISEAGHASLFIELALLYHDQDDVYARLQFMLEREAELIASLPHAPVIH